MIINIIIIIIILKEKEKQKIQTWFKQSVPHCKRNDATAAAFVRVNNKTPSIFILLFHLLPLHNGSTSLW